MGEIEIKKDTLVMKLLDGRPVARLVSRIGEDEDCVYIYEPIVRRDVIEHRMNLVAVAQTDGSFDDPKKALEAHQKEVIENLANELFTLWQGIRVVNDMSKGGPS